MSSEQVTMAFDNARFEEALAEYELALEANGHLNVEQWLEKYQDIATELKQCIANRDHLEALVSPIRSAITAQASEELPTVANYEIIEELGKGGMGIVYKAKQKGTDQIVALKMLRSDWLDQLSGEERKHAIDQFLLETKTAAKLRHPNVVTIYHTGEHEGRPYYVMECIPGESLADKLEKFETGLSNEDILRYIIQIAHAVDEAHKRGILHRDLKPANILIDQQTDRALVVDFGLALLRDEENAKQSSSEMSVRSRARVLGTLPYMSPEQTIDSDTVTVASDIYSLGATFYELLTGTRPFTGKSRDELLTMIRKSPPKSPRILQTTKAINPKVEQICLKCLEKQPEKRFASAREVAEQIQNYLHEVQYAKNFTAMGRGYMLTGVIALCTNFAVYWMLQNNTWEPIIWSVVFSMYFSLFLIYLLSPKNSSRESYLSQVDFWSIWGGKMFSAIGISIAIRSMPGISPHQAILQTYPVFAALSGMAAFILVVKMSPKLIVLAALGWVFAIVMSIDIQHAPLYYGVYALFGCFAFGLYLTQVARDLG